MGGQEILAIAATLGLLIVLSGCWIMMRYLRTRPSRLLFTSVVALILWAVLSDTVYSAVFYYSDLSKPKPWQNWFYLSLEIAVPAFLILCASTCFWLVARSLPRPSNSTKPTSLRDNAELQSEP